LEYRRPVLVSIGVFSAHPTNKVAIVEPKPKQGAGVEEGSIHGQLGGLAWYGPLTAEWFEGGQDSFVAETMIKKPFAANFGRSVAILWSEKGPSEMQTDVAGWFFVGSRPAGRRLSKAPTASPIW
jgi:hypothetical protein